SAHLSEKGKRIWAASEAVTIGYGGDTIVSEATGISRVTIKRGKNEIEEGVSAESVRIRKGGGGRKHPDVIQPDIIKELDIMINPFSRGYPESPLRRTCKSTYNLAKALQEKGYKISQKSVYTLMQKMGYSMQSNCKTGRKAAS
ncbi:MAG: ISAzo13 family transposase, partial [Desulfobacteraceae bacterium]|nr:ISAzo13 family transposase [Desulfobacteraceae bacterium]